MPWKRSYLISRSACMPNGARAIQAVHARGVPPYAYCPGRRGSYRSRRTNPPGACWVGIPRHERKGITPMKNAQTKQTTPTPPAAPVPATQPPAPAVVPLDPLRGVKNFYDLEKKQPKEAKALRAQLMEQITRALPKMDTSQVQEIAQFLDLCANDRGCVTPAEA